jgi:protein disulfide-isomerase A1
MKTSIRYLTIILGISILVSVSPAQSPILSFSESNFETEISKLESCIVFFTSSPRNPLTNLVDQELTSAMKILQEEDPSVVLAKVELSNDSELLKKFRVGIPTVAMFINGQLDKPYKYKKDARHYADWAKKHSHLFVKASGSSDFEMLKRTNKQVIVLFDEDNQAFKESAKKHDDIIFVTCPTAECLTLQEKGTILLFKDFGKEVYKFNNHKSIDELIMEFSLPLLNKFDKNSHSIYTQEKGYPGLFFITNDSSHLDKYEKLLTTIAEKFRREVKVFIVDLGTSGNSHYLNTANDTFPTLKIMAFNDVVGRQYYDFSGDLENIEQIERFINDWKAGNVKTTPLSAKVPEKQDGPAIEVVAKTFDEIVFNSPQNVLLMFYTPTCPSCKKFFPVWEQVVEKFKNTENLLIAKINAAVNDRHPDVTVTSVPSLLLFKAGDKKSPVRLGGDDADRTFEYTVEFVNSGLGIHTKSDL